MAEKLKKYVLVAGKHRDGVTGKVIAVGSVLELTAKAAYQLRDKVRPVGQEKAAPQATKPAAQVQRPNPEADHKSKGEDAGDDQKTGDDDKK